MFGFCFTLIGLVVGHRIFSYLQKKVFDIQIVRVLQWSWTVLMLMTFIFFYNHLTYLWILQMLLLISPGVVLLIHEKRRRKQFHRQLLQLLDSILAQMIAGQTLKSALEAEYCFSPAVKFQIRELLSALQFDSKATDFKDELTARTFSVFSEIYKSQHRGIEKIRAFRDHIRTIERFRRKSGQVTAQVRAQIIVLSVLYFVLLAGVLKFSNTTALSGLVFTSIALFCLGSALTFSIPRMFKWKI